MTTNRITIGTLAGS